MDPFGLKYAERYAVYGIMIGSSIAAGLSVVGDVGTFGVNIVATPAEIAAGGALGGAIGYAIGNLIDQNILMSEESRRRDKERSTCEVTSTPASPDPLDPMKGIGGRGWRGDRNWRQAVRQVDRGGTIENINGKIPTRQEALDLIKEAGGKIVRVHDAHGGPSTHKYPHINYTTRSGMKGTIRIVGM